MFGVASNRDRSAWLDSLTRGMVIAAAASLFSLSACSDTPEPDHAQSLRPESQSRRVSDPLVPPAIPPKSTPKFNPNARSAFSVPKQGRLAIKRAQIMGLSEVPLVLTIEDEGSPTDVRKARVVAVVGRRFDGDAIPIPDEPSRFEIGVPAAFLEVGLYMIEVDAVDAHPIDLRRFVVEVLP